MGKTTISAPSCKHGSPIGMTNQLTRSSVPFEHAPAASALGNDLAVGIFLFRHGYKAFSHHPADGSHFKRLDHQWYDISAAEAENEAKRLYGPHDIWEVQPSVQNSPTLA